MTGRPPQDYQQFIGMESGLLRIVEEGKKDKNSIKFMIAECRCGNKIEVRLGDYKKGRYNSCGCNHGSKRRTHGGKGTRLYDLWCGIINRCECPTATHYHLYGARGITMCNAWRVSFEDFRSWSLANGYTDELTIDRINSNGNYEPSNCRWVTAKVQGNNTRRNRKLVYKGQKLTIGELEAFSAVSYKVLYDRIFKLGWDINSAVESPLNSRK